jgi:hypothetical protein
VLLVVAQQQVAEQKLENIESTETYIESPQYNTYVMIDRHSIDIMETKLGNETVIT